jgi:hypothetical protein
LIARYIVYGRHLDPERSRGLVRQEVSAGTLAKETVMIRITSRALAEESRTNPR